MGQGSWDGDVVGGGVAASVFGPQPCGHRLPGPAGAVVDASHQWVVPEGLLPGGRRVLLVGVGEYLRDLDQKGCDLSVAGLPADEGLGLAIANRLRRAAGPPALRLSSHGQGGQDAVRTATSRPRLRRAGRRSAKGACHRRRANLFIGMFATSTPTFRIRSNRVLVTDPGIMGQPLGVTRPRPAASPAPSVSGGQSRVRVRKPVRRLFVAVSHRSASDPP